MNAQERFLPVSTLVLVIEGSAEFSVGVVNAEEPSVAVEGSCVDVSLVALFNSVLDVSRSSIGVAFVVFG